jgi:ABC-2 type transport system ATP-binding protein
MSVIEANGLTKVYKTYLKRPGLIGAVQGLFHRESTETRAVDGVSFRIEDGEFVGFLGPNGAGKTTVLKMLSGLLNPSSGEARVLGYIPWHREDALKRQFSLLMGQKNALWWDLPARESLELNRAIYGIPQETYRKTVHELTELLDVASKLDVMVRELSLGERMKFELISALLHRPKVLFLDEPTIGLDVTSQKTVREFLKAYNQERPIVTMLTSHYMGDIEALCHRVIVIDRGRIFYDGPLAGIIEKFSMHKLLTVHFSAAAERDLVPFGEVVRNEPMEAVLRVDRFRIPEVCREVLGRFPVMDLSVEDPPVEEIIRQLFESKKVADPEVTSA